MRTILLMKEHYIERWQIGPAKKKKKRWMGYCISFLAKEKYVGKNWAEQKLVQCINDINIKWLTECFITYREEIIKKKNCEYIVDRSEV